MIINIIIATMTRMAAIIMILMVPTMKEKEEAASEKKGLLKWVLKRGKGFLYPLCVLDSIK